MLNFSLLLIAPKMYSTKLKQFEQRKKGHLELLECWWSELTIQVQVLLERVCRVVEDTCFFTLSACNVSHSPLHCWSYYLSNPCNL